VNGSQFFSWFQTSGDQTYPVATYPAGATTGTYIGVPFLTDSNAAVVNAYLTSLPAGSIRAVKVENPGISNGTANLIFNNANYNVSYVFGDREGATAQADALALSKQVRLVNPGGSFNSSNWSQSFRAFVGNFGFSYQADNKQRPSYYNFNGQHSFSDYNFQQSTAALLNMSNEETYPGSASMRNKAAGDAPLGGGTLPNIRGNLFVLPLWRVGQATQAIQASGLDSTVQHVPYTANFNNWGNPALDTDRNPSNGYLFVPGAPMPSATINGHFYPALIGAQTVNQNLSRQDTANLALHYRLRNADSYHLLDSGIIDNPATPENEAVSRQDMEQDFATGWLGEKEVDDIFAQGDHRTLIGEEAIPVSYGAGGSYGDGSTIWVDGVKSNVERSASAFSGAYSLSLEKLDVLISNMDDAQHTIQLPESVGGYALATKDFTLAGGSHILVQYTLEKIKGKQTWTNALEHVPFTAIANSRNGFGIPEPGTLSLLAVAGVLGLNRRSRKAQ